MYRYASSRGDRHRVKIRAYATAEVTPSGTGILASDREVTRLGASVFNAGEISKEAMDFVSGVLSRMAQTYQKLDMVGVRAVATAAVRDASNQAEFIARASQALGAPVEIISGQEEARLIHLGVQTRWPHPKQRIMIVDVGGGSGEIILAENGQLVEAVSKPLGAVRLTGVFLEHDPPNQIELLRLQEFIDEKLRRRTQAWREASGPRDRDLGHRRRNGGSREPHPARAPRRRRPAARHRRAGSQVI